MRTVSGLFDRYEQVIEAVDALSNAGIPASEITVVSPDGEGGTRTKEGVGVGAAVGGIGGLLAGIGAFTVPGLGQMIGVGWLVPMLIGAASGGLAGGVIGSLTSAGVDEGDAHIYAEGVRRGGTLVMARVEDSQAGVAKAILAQAGSIDTATRRSEYAADGWDGFADKDIWDEDIGSEDQEPSRAAPIIPALPR